MAPHTSTKKRLAKPSFQYSNNSTNFFRISQCTPNRQNTRSCTYSQFQFCLQHIFISFPKQTKHHKKSYFYLLPLIISLGIWPLACLFYKRNLFQFQSNVSLLILSSNGHCCYSSTFSDTQFTSTRFFFLSSTNTSLFLFIKSFFNNLSLLINTKLDEPLN